MSRVLRNGEKTKAKMKTETKETQRKRFVFKDKIAAFISVLLLVNSAASSSLESGKKFFESKLSSPVSTIPFGSWFGKTSILISFEKFTFKVGNLKEDLVANKFIIGSCDWAKWSITFTSLDWKGDLSSSTCRVFKESFGRASLETCDWK